MERRAPAPASPAVAIVADGVRSALTGHLDIQTLADAERSFKHWLKQRKSRALDLGDLTGLDTPGALLLCDLRRQGVDLTGVSAAHQALLDLVCGLEIKPLPAAPSIPRWRQLVVTLGRGADEAWRDAVDVITFVGRAASVLAHALVHPRCLRLASISRHVEETGINALPIIGLMAVMISVVIGYQGVAQLRPYGGEDFTDQSRGRVGACAKWAC